MTDVKTNTHFLIHLSDHVVILPSFSGNVFFFFKCTNDTEDTLTTRCGFAVGIILLVACNLDEGGLYLVSGAGCRQFKCHVGLVKGAQPICQSANIMSR